MKYFLFIIVLVLFIESNDTLLKYFSYHLVVNIACQLLPDF